MQDTHMKIINYLEDIKAILKMKECCQFLSDTQSKMLILAYLSCMTTCLILCFFSLLKEISMGLHTLHLSMAYRKDIILLYKELTCIYLSVYDECVDYLQEKDVLPRPPAVTMLKVCGVCRGNQLEEWIQLVF